MTSNPWRYYTLWIPLIGDLESDEFAVISNADLTLDSYIPST